MEFAADSAGFAEKVLELAGDKIGSKAWLTFTLGSGGTQTLGFKPFCLHMVMAQPDGIPEVTVMLYMCFGIGTGVSAVLMGGTYGSLAIDKEDLGGSTIRWKDDKNSKRAKVVIYRLGNLGSEIQG